MGDPALLRENLELERRIADLEDRLSLAESRIGKVTDTGEYPTAETADLGHIPDPDLFFRKIIQSSISGVYVYDAELLHNVYINPRYSELTGYTLEDLNVLPGEEFLQLFHRDDHDAVRQHMEEVTRADDHEIVPLEYRFRTRWGDWLWCLSHDVVFERGPGGRVKRFLGSFVDITEQKRVQEDLEHFTHVAAHDLREPSKRMKLCADLLSSEVGVIRDGPAAKLLGTIARESDQMLRLIGDFRSLMKVGSGRAPRGEEIVPSAVIDSVLGEIKARLQARNVDVVIEKHPSIPAYPTLLHPLYRNLVENALQYGEYGMELSFTVENVRGLWIFGVRNTGSSVPQDIAARIFTPFRRFVQTGEGSGLGLAIAKRIVDHHRGRIWVESRDDVTHFKFTLERDR